ncbi:MAG: tetratricopeptide repeat protein [Candidatus Sericytochromatia bacterium]|nr:tetratricopeptide repeat protein [Candidatus Sericytochromatia bacterium]
MTAETPASPQTIQHWLQQGALTAAEEAISARLAHNPEEAEAWLLQGQLKSRQQQNDQALAAFEYALCLQPDLHAAHAELASLCRSAGQLALALKHLSAARAFAPVNSTEQRQYTQTLIEVSLDSGELSEASLHLKNLLQMAPDAADSYWLCGRVMAALGQNQAAEAAFLQSLHLQPDQVAVRLDLTCFYLQHRAWLQATQVLSPLQKLTLTAQQQARWLTLQGCCDFWQGELPSARERWRQALAEHFSLQTLTHLCLGLPLVSQSPADAMQWQSVLEEGLDLLQQQAQAPPAEQIPWEQVPAPWLTQTRLTLGSWLERHCTTPALPARQPEAPYRLGIVVDHLLRPGLADSLKQLLETQPAEHALQIFYLQQITLPDLLSPWQHQFQMLPQMAPAMIQQLAQAQLDVLAYWDLTPLLYAAAVARPAHLQVLLPEASPVSSGLQRMDLVLSAPAESVYWDQAPERALALTDLRFPLVDLPEAAANSAPTSPRQKRELRQSLGLPRLRRVYGLLAEPQHWLPDIDPFLKGLLEQEPQALLVALPLRGSVLHTHLQQRHAQSLGAQASRVRWLPAQTPTDSLIKALDGLIALPWAADGWQSFQALQSGVPLLTWEQTDPQPAARWLQACGLPVAESQEALLKVLKQTNSDQHTPRRVMLKADQIARNIHNMIYTEWLQKTEL